MRFEEQRYYDEMGLLLRTAKQALKAEHPGLPIYTIAIWTDPDAAVSAVNFDTYANSVARVAAQNQWSKVHYDRLIRQGDADQAKLFLPSRGWLYNPADFALSQFRVTKHSSFDPHWEEDSRGQCWDLLEPALSHVGEAAMDLFRDILLHPDAELGVNGRSDWYALSWPFS